MLHFLPNCCMILRLHVDFAGFAFATISQSVNFTQVYKKMPPVNFFNKTIQPESVSKPLLFTSKSVTSNYITLYTHLYKCYRVVLHAQIKEEKSSLSTDLFRGCCSGTDDQLQVVLYTYQFSKFVKCQDLTKIFSKLYINSFARE